tara:strand:- start:129 stop:329 length:201 start_codon:yes stop_codon:yes gene_type:complete
MEETVVVVQEVGVVLMPRVVLAAEAVLVSLAAEAAVTLVDQVEAGQAAKEVVVAVHIIMAPTKVTE